MKGGIPLDNNNWITTFKNKRSEYGVSQNKLALVAGMSREHLNRIESSKVTLTEKTKMQLTTALEKLNPDNPLEMLFDYVRIRFPTMNIQHVIKDILKLNIDFMLHEDFGFYSYTEHYYIGDIFILMSQDEKKGVLLELKGKGCRQMESYLLAQKRSWYDFFMDVLIDGGVIKRLDLAINDKYGILDIPELIEKCNREECVSLFRTYKSYASGELIKNLEQDKVGMGHTLYIGSLKSEVYFCIYEKSMEQYSKLGISPAEAPVKNRFEIRLKNDRAYHAIRDLLTYYDEERTAFNIINHYLRFVDKEIHRKSSDCPVNERWSWFIGSNRGRLKLTTKPEPYTMERTLNWITRQVAPTLKMTKSIDLINGTNVIESLVKNAKLTKKHEKIIEQQTASNDEITCD